MSYVKPVVYYISQFLENVQRHGGNTSPEWEYDLETLVKAWMPSGSGIDCGTKLDFEKSTPIKLVFTFDYHHMNEGGYYCGWSSHKLIVTPTFDDFNLKIIGQHPSKQKHQTDIFHDYLYSTYRHFLGCMFRYTVDNNTKERVYTYVDNVNPDVEREAKWQVRIPAHWLRNDKVTT